MKFERLELLVGNENLNLIQDKTVMIVGLGGVGGYATESIVRCGIKKIVIVDFDTIDESNINRQIIATIDSVDKYKVDAWEERIKKINPDCEVIKVKEYIDENNIDHLFDYNLDYIVDACDSLKTKMDLIRKSIEYNVKLISSMGTGNKLDPSKLKIMDIRKTSYDPLAKHIRKMVKDEKINSKVMVVCSDEKGIKKVQGTIPSNSFVPATAGLLCTSYIINDIIKTGDNNEKNK